MKLMVCDNDEAAVALMRDNPDNASLGITKVLCASDSMTARRLIDQERPELILCAMESPPSGGTDMLKVLSSLDYHPEFAMLAWHRSFDDVRTALRYGAANYLTKPIDPGELQVALQRMIAAWNARENQRETVCPVTHFQADSLNNDFLKSLRDGVYGTDKDKIEETIRRRRMDLQAETMIRCVMVRTDPYGALQSGWDKDLFLYTFHYMCQEAVAGQLDFNDSILDIEERSTLVTMVLDADEKSEEELSCRCARLISACSTYLKVRPTCLIGEPMLLWQWPSLAPEIQKRVFQIRLQSGKVCLFREKTTGTGRIFPILNGTRVLDCVRRRDRGGYIAEVFSVVNKISMDKVDGDYAISLLHHDLIRTFYTYLEDNGIPSHMLLADENIRELDSKAARSSFDLMNFAFHLYDTTVTRLQASGGADDLVQRARKYIDVHYRENIDRDSVAAVAYVTPNYLSKRFGAETGMNMREYINKLRIREAKRLLLSTDLPAGKIAGDVGFDSISYFSTVFRKQCGMSPTDWRNEERKEAAV